MLVIKGQLQCDLTKHLFGHNPRIHVIYCDEIAHKCLVRLNDDVMTFLFCKSNAFLALIQHHNSGTKREVVTIFHIWSDWICDCTVLLGWRSVWSLHILNSKTSSLSPRISTIGRACEHAQGMWLFFFFSFSEWIYTLKAIKACNKSLNPKSNQISSIYMLQM